MSAIAFKIRKNGQYLDVQVCIFGNWTDIGLCDEVESEAIAEALRAAADDLSPPEGEPE
jgi:hypothetical protein